jgi:hypothetical protein
VPVFAEKTRLETNEKIKTASCKKGRFSHKSVLKKHKEFSRGTQRKIRAHKKLSFKERRKKRGEMP